MVRPCVVQNHAQHVQREGLLVAMYTGEDDEQGQTHHNNCVEFYRIVRASYTHDEMKGMAVRAAATFKIAAERGLIPWEYDGQREDLARDLHDDSFKWPEPPAWGEAA